MTAAVHRAVNHALPGVHGVRVAQDGGVVGCGPVTGAAVTATDASADRAQPGPPSYSHRGLLGCQGRREQARTPRTPRSARGWPWWGRRAGMTTGRLAIHDGLTSPVRRRSLPHMCISLACWSPIPSGMVILPEEDESVPPWVQCTSNSLPSGSA